MSAATSLSLKCVKNPEYFCYICGCFTIPSQRKNISTFVKQAYFAYFKAKLGDQDKSWAPHKYANKVLRVKACGPKEK